MKKHLIIIIFLLCASFLVTLKLLKNERSERQRYQSNTNALLAQNRAYLTQQGRWAMDVQTLELKNSELKEHYAQATTTIRRQGVKIKHLESIATSQSITELSIATAIRDTVIFNQVSPIVGSVFNWSDPWVSIDGVIKRDSVRCQVQSVDTLLQYVYRVPRKFLFIRWGTKEIRQSIISSNPHTKIVYSEYVKLRRKGRKN